MEAYNESICVSISMDFIAGCMGALRLTKTQGCVETKLSIFRHTFAKMYILNDGDPYSLQDSVSAVITTARMYVWYKPFTTLFM
jgi:hypothetical protein